MWGGWGGGGHALRGEWEFDEGDRESGDMLNGERDIERWNLLSLSPWMSHELPEDVSRGLAERYSKALELKVIH